MYLGVAVVVLFGGSFVHAEENNSDIVVTNAWVRVMPPSQRNTAAYMTIENKTDRDVILKSATTQAAEEVQTHEMKHEDGMMKMRKVEGIVVPAYSHAMLQSGGLHLMLLRLTRTIKNGDEIPIVLTFQGGAHFTCPMHPEIHQEEQGDCPKCGMTLEHESFDMTVIAKAQDDATDHANTEHAHHE